jgi:hypothetical protein
MTIDWKKRQAERMSGPLCQVCRRTEVAGDHVHSASMGFTAEGEVPRSATHRFVPMQPPKRCRCGHYTSIHTRSFVSTDGKSTYDACTVDGCTCTTLRRPLVVGVDYAAGL